MIRMQKSLQSQVRKTLETLHRHWDFTLFNNNVNHQEASWETIEAHQCFIISTLLYGSRPCDACCSSSIQLWLLQNVTF